MKRLSVFSIFLLLHLAAMSFTGNVEINGIWYHIVTKGAEAEVIRGNSYMGVIVIPEAIEYEGVTCSVTSIGDYAFSDCSGLTSIHIGNNVRSIGKNAFSACSGLVTVAIGSNVTYIRESAFYNCSGLTSITIPNSVTTIGNQAFSYCDGLITVVIGNNVSSIGNSAFYNCSGLVSVTIPNSVTHIGDKAFEGCTGLSSVHISDIAAWCRILFDSYSLYTSNPLRYAKHLYLNGKEVKDLLIPSSVTSIGGGSFFYCSSLTSVTIPNNVVSIGNYAFRACENLTSVKIGSSVTSIGDYAFANCQELSDVYCYADKKPKLEWEVFYDSYVNYATLHVPSSLIKEYSGWGGFGNIVSIEDNKCATPNIYYNKGKLEFSCDTEGAVCQTSITDDDVKSYIGNEIQLGITYTIKVYATKVGYEDSETVTATLCWIDVEPKSEGLSNDVAQVRANAALIQCHNGIVTVSGLDNGTIITVYSVSGHLIGSAKTKGNKSSLVTNLKSGDIAIVKIGDKSVKVVMQ